MRARLLMLVAISALLLAQAYPQVCEAKGKKGAVKKKPKKGETDSSVSDNPYAGEEAAAESEGETEGEADIEEAESKSLAEAAAEALEGGGEAEGETGGILERGGGEAGSVRRSNRMEFDERLVKGQAAKSGAVYLFKRVPRRLPGLVPMRRSYRKRIVEPVLGERELKPAVYSEEPPAEEPVAEQAAEKPPGDKAPEAAAEKDKPKAEKAEAKPEPKK